MREKHLIFGAGTVEGLLSEIDSMRARIPGFSPVFKRFFLSDVSQKRFFPHENGAVSYIVQPPLDGSSVAVWIYLVAGAESVSYSFGCTRVMDSGLEHIWSSSILSAGGDSLTQTASILERFEDSLESEGLDISSDCVRTWFFCHDIDHNYSGLVKARRQNFALHGMTPETHYIASTGINGTPVADGSIVQMDAYSIRGKYPFRFLYAPTHLNPTYEYGVTFERGVRIDYSGRGHCLISGTASIDNKGEVLHAGDVAEQTVRMWENVEALLQEGGMAWGDIRMALVYLRNPSDHAIVAPMFSERLSGVPCVILEAPVCRPDWLIEMECIAERPLV